MRKKAMNPIWKIAMSENCIIAIQVIHSYLMSQDIIMERNGGIYTFRDGSCTHPAGQYWWCCPGIWERTCL